MGNTWVTIHNLTFERFQAFYLNNPYSIILPGKTSVSFEGVNELIGCIDPRYPSKINPAYLLKNPGKMIVSNSTYLWTYSPGEYFGEKTITIQYVKGPTNYTIGQPLSPATNLKSHTVANLSSEIIKVFINDMSFLLQPGEQTIYDGKYKIEKKSTITIDNDSYQSLIVQDSPYHRIWLVNESMETLIVYDKEGQSSIVPKGIRDCVEVESIRDSNNISMERLQPNSKYAIDTKTFHITVDSLDPKKTYVTVHPNKGG
jgi:hypothetical protein